MVDRIVTSGQTQKIFWFTVIDPTCKSAGDLTISLTESPDYGSVKSERGMDFPQYPQEHALSRCNSKKVPVRNIFYTSNPDYKGEDTFVVEAVNSRGQPTRIRFHVFIR